MARRAVVLMNLGGPDSLSAVRPFLYNLFSDPAIIGLPAPLRLPPARGVRGAAGAAARLGDRGAAGADRASDLRPAWWRLSIIRQYRGAGAGAGGGARRR